MENQNITMGAFVEMLLFYLNKEDMNIESLISLNILEDSDRNQEQFVNKKTLARILHQCLLVCLFEPDLSDYSAALILKDINDCHTCTRHIAQVYSKGIIPAAFDRIFGNELLVSYEDCKDYVKRLFDSKLRVVPAATKKEIQYISQSDLDNFKSDSILIDVRSFEDFDEALIPDKGLWKNIPLREIQLNPYIVGSDLCKPIVLQCKEGYLASVAAKLLIKYGYNMIYVYTS